MANITVERSAIADFLDDLPSLLLQYKQLQWAQEERALEREFKMDIQEKALDIAASKSLYNENKKLYYDALNNLQTLQTSYGETVGSLDPLSEMYTASGKDVTADIYKGEATNYQARADQHLENWQAVQNKIDVLQESIFTDVKRAKNIMAGGAGFEGGVDPTGWDLSDLGIVAYESRFGESSPTVVAMFENNPGLMTTSLANLQKTEGALGLTQEKRAYYKKTGIEKTSDNAIKQAELVFGTISSSAIKTSGKQEYDGLILQKSQFDDRTSADVIDENTTRQFNLTKEIGKEFSELIGQVSTPEEYLEITSDYFEMLNLGKGASVVRQGQTAYGNWSVYKDYIIQARDEYVRALQAGDPEKARRLNQLAEKYLGKPLDVELTTFANDMSSYFSDTILSSFGNDILSEDLNPIPVDTTNVNIDDLENIENKEWEDLLGE